MSLMPAFSEQELATVLAALRYWQADLEQNRDLGLEGDGPGPAYHPDFSDYFAEHAPLSIEQIDCLCEALKHESETIEELSAEYQTWCDERGFPPRSADELLYAIDHHGAVGVKGVTATPAQRAYIARFIHRWDAAMAREPRP